MNRRCRAEGAVIVADLIGKRKRNWKEMGAALMCEEVLGLD